MLPQTDVNIISERINIYVTIEKKYWRFYLDFFISIFQDLKIYSEILFN